MRRCKDRRHLLLGMEDRLRQEEMEQQSNKEANQGWRLAADAARLTDLNIGCEDRKHTSGVMFVAVVRNLGAVVGTVSSRQRG